MKIDHAESYRTREEMMGFATLNPSHALRAGGVTVFALNSCVVGILLPTDDLILWVSHVGAQPRGSKMSDDKPGIGSGVPEPILTEIYRDAKSAILWTTHSTMQPFQRLMDHRAALAAFHPDFPAHGRNVTDLVDYVKWHEGDKDWREGTGRLSSATYGELPHFWTRPERFARYEAHLVRFIQAGGEVRRIFVLGCRIARRCASLSALPNPAPTSKIRL